MLILILIDIQYSQNAVFSFEKGLNRQNHSSSRFHQPVKKFLPSNISDSPATGGIYPHPYRYLENPTVYRNQKKNFTEKVWKKRYLSCKGTSEEQQSLQQRFYLKTFGNSHHKESNSF